MIFQHTWEKVLSGEKTETRRLIGPHDVYDPHWIPTTIMTDMCRIKYQAGKFYSVQPGRGKPGIAQIQLLDIYPEDVRMITFDHLQAEGFYSHVDFWRTWCLMHDPKMQIYNDTMTGIFCASLFPNERQPRSPKSRKVMHVDDVNMLQKVLLDRPNDRYQAFVYRFKLAS